QPSRPPSSSCCSRAARRSCCSPTRRTPQATACTSGSASGRWRTSSTSTSSAPPAFDPRAPPGTPLLAKRAGAARGGAVATATGAGDVAQRARGAAREAADSRPVDWAARAGLSARGLVYLLVGVLALLVAFGGHQHVDQKGALQQVLAKPF